MSKKMLTIVLALVAIGVFAGPAGAQAATLTSSEGQLKAGMEVTAVSTNVTMPVYAGVTMKCASVTVNAETSGEGTEITGLAGPATAAGCQYSPSGYAYTITSFDLGFDFDASSANLEYTYDAPAVGAKNCHMSGTVGASFGGESDVVSISGGPLQGWGTACPTGAQGISGSFSLQDPAAGNSPVYVS